MPAKGLTLVELLTTLVVCSVLLSIGLTDFGSLVQESRLDSEAQKLAAHIQYARTSAIHLRRIVTLCPSDGPSTRRGTRCGSEWNRSIKVFVDGDGDAVHEEPEDALLATAPLHDRIAISWRSFSRRSALQFRPDGGTHIANGTFTLCTIGAEPTARRLVINVGGRMRSERYDGRSARALCE